MVSFDLGACVQRYIPHRWKIVKISSRASQVFAQYCVLGAIADKRDTKVRSLSRAIRRLWTKRLQELVGRNLWALNIKTDNFDKRKFELTFRRCFFCRPTYLYYFWRKETVFRPCRRDAFCPFCFARICAWSYRHVKKTLRTIGAQDPTTKLVMTCRVVSRFIAAADFHPTLGCSDSQILVYTKILRGELQRHQYAYNKCAKQLQRTTKGSMCRTVVIPQKTGWRIETRQFLVHAPKIKLPVVRLPGAKVQYLKSCRLADDFAKPETSSEFFFMLAEFHRYPRELLTGYAEFTAAYLHARQDLRLLSGTGVCRKTGQSLGAYFKQKDADARASRAAKKTA